ncbi:hypothetical protein CFC21_111508 [Triticum aestivum]|uniref:Aminotransferase-like plant mobile domain-containing protein n=2 Tax=Triticum aestivum TaxID=4565 RepID=A0A9R1MQ92_WHEAT|nr:hypothetical protein CFC21_111508 [Triticum aestivum]
MVIIGGDADGNEEDRSGSQSLRWNSKRPANRQPRSARSVEQGEDVEDADEFRVVKRTRRATLGKGAESSSRAAVAGGAVASSAADAEANGEGVEVAAGEDVERPSQAGRIRASPARFANFNASLTPLQKSELVSRLFGGLLNLSDTLPADLSKFLVQSYQPQTSEMVFPGRGRIRVDADSVQRVFDLPNRGQKVRYLVDKDATRRFRQAFNITGNSHPQITTWLKMIQDMAGRTDDTFFMAWLAILYLDALVHDIPVSNCAIRSNAWDSTLIAKVIKKDTISPGVIKKDTLKEEYRGTEQTPLFDGILQAEAFVASKLPITYNPQAKIAKVVNDLCKAVTEQVGTFIEAVAKIDDEEPDIDPYEMPWSLNPYEDQSLIMVTGSMMHHLLTSA